MLRPAAEHGRDEGAGKVNRDELLAIYDDLESLCRRLRTAGFEELANRLSGFVQCGCTFGEIWSAVLPTLHNLRKHPPDGIATELLDLAADIVDRVTHIWPAGTCGHPDMDRTW